MHTWAGLGDIVSHGGIIQQQVGNGVGELSDVKATVFPLALLSSLENPLFPCLGRPEPGHWLFGDRMKTGLEGQSSMGRFSLTLMLFTFMLHLYPLLLDFSRG